MTGSFSHALSSGFTITNGMANSLSTDARLIFARETVFPAVDLANNLDWLAESREEVLARVKERSTSQPQLRTGLGAKEKARWSRADALIQRA
jgi:hypothetical protein